MKKLQKSKPNEYIRKHFSHKNCSKINQYQNIKLKNQVNKMRPLDLTLQPISPTTY